MVIYSWVYLWALDFVQLVYVSFCCCCFLFALNYSHVWMWELDYKESWAPKSWCFGTVMLEKTLESPLDCKEILPVYPKGNQSWMFIGRTGVEAETPMLWPPDAKSWFIGKNPVAGKDWGQEEKGTKEDEMVRWHHWFNGQEHVRLSCPLPSPGACSIHVHWLGDVI